MLPATPTCFPVHPSQISAEVAATLAAASAPLDAEDQALEAAILRSLRETRLPLRVPVLAAALKREHPDLSQRAIFRVLEVRLGLSYSHVRDLFYRHRREVVGC